MEAKIIFVDRINTGEHVDVRPGGEELVTGAGENHDVDIFVHACAQDSVVELPVHLVRVGVGGWIIDLEDGRAGVNTVADQGLLDCFFCCRHCKSSIKI